jgi:translation initiation factor IF-2
MSTGAKMRVYEIAREVGIPNKDLLAKIRALGLEVNNHMSSLDADDVARIKRSLEKDRQSSTETQRLSSTVLRRRSSKADEVDAPEAPPPPSPPAPAPSAAAPVVRRRPAEPSSEPVRAAEPPRHAEPVRHAEPSGDEPDHDVESDEPEPVHAAPEPAPAPVVKRPEPAPTFHDEPEPAAPPVRTAASAPERQPEPVAPSPEPAPVVLAEEPRIVTNPPVAEPAPVAPASPPPSAVTAAPAVTPPPAEPKPKSRVIINGPQMMGRSATAEPARPAPTRQEAAPAPPRQEAAPSRGPINQSNRPQPTVIVRQRDGGSMGTPVASAQPTGHSAREPETARSRFEAELERARARVAEREREIEKEKAETAPKVEAPPADPNRDPSRPAVGSIIALPTRIKITERAPAPGRTQVVVPGANQIRGRFAQQQQKGGPKPGQRDFGKKKLPLGKKGKATQLTTPAEHKRVIRIEDTIAISELARNMGVKATEVLKKLWGMGMTGVNINASIDLDTSQMLAAEFGYEVQNVAFKEAAIFSDRPDEDAQLLHRSPVVTVMGHVDHGKTSLLDAIRKTRVAAGESGGITQHIAAYKVKAPGHGDIVFLDTPGHEAFTEMRARGAQATDIVILVVAANDGVMPQTLEALAHAKDAKVSIIVAVNKIDMPDAAPERVRQQLADHGLIPEEWGGDTIYVNVSALRGENIEKLLEQVAVTAEVLELRANPDKPASGLVIEARLDRNRGPMATVLIQEGTLRVGDVVVAGRTLGKVRALLDDRGQSVKEAGPSTPVEILGLDGVPEAGESVNVADDEKVAKTVVEHRRQSWRKRELASTAKVSLESMMERMAESENKELKIVLKADVQGSAEALKAALVKLSGDKVKVHVISAGVGGITESDVNLAKAGGAIIVGFHVRPAGKSAKLAEQEGVQIRLYDIIYDALDEVKLAMAGLLAPIKREVAMGKLEVRDTFTIPKIGTVAGSMVTEGKITRKALLRVFRDSVQVYEGRVGSLRRFKDDVSEVQNGYECGLMVAGFNDLKAGDIVEAYEVVEEAARL